MALKFAVTNLAGQQVAFLPNFTNALITIPYNDSRTAELTINPDSAEAAEIIPLSRMLKAWYVWPDGTTHLVFWGPIMTPTWSFRLGEKTLKVEAHDLSIRLKNHYLSGADTAIFTADPGLVPVSGGGLRMLRDAGKNATAENTAGVPDLGIANGTDTHPGPFTVAKLTAAFAAGNTTMHVDSTIGFPSSGSAPDDTIYINTTPLTYTGRTATTFTGVSGYAGATQAIGTSVFFNTARELQVHKGDNVWDRVKEIADDPFGPDVKLRPDDATPGVYALLDTLDKAETEGGVRDKRLAVIFQAGFGSDNVESFEYAPQGGSVRNRAVVQQAHSDPDTADKTYITTNLASRIKYANYVSWEAGGDSDSVEMLKGKAEAVLLAYSEPPQNFSFTPRADDNQRFIYGRDYEEGDVISCGAHFGALRLLLPGFINEVRLRQQSQTGQTKAEIDALPEIVDQTDVDADG